MRALGCEIIGLGKGLPKRIMHNKELESIVDTTDEWITTRTGIKSRHIVADDEATSDLCVKAAKEALANAKLSPEDIELIIVATMTPDFPYPSTAAMVQGKLGAVNAGAFDLMAACSGFVYALVTAEGFIKLGRYKNILIIGGEVFSRVLNWEDRNSCVLFGDGAAAAVLQATDDSEKGICSFELAADGTGWDKLTAFSGGTKYPINAERLANKEHLLTMKGPEVFKFAVKVVPASILRVIEKSSYSLDDVKMIVPHQANLRIIESVAKRLNLPMDKFFMNMDRYANTSAASIGLALYDAMAEGKISKGDLVVFVGFGAGLTHATCLIRL